jgi:pimeloyl-ACP methyl ester carboxylesterase
VEALQQTSAVVARRTIADNRPWNVREAVEAVAVPTVILGSDPESGGIMPVSLGERLAAGNRLIRSTVLAGAGHSVHREEARYPGYLAALQDALEWIEGEGG